MKINYRGCEIEAKKDICLSGWDITSLTIYRGKYEVLFTFSELKDTEEEHIIALKKIVDDFIDNYHQDENKWEDRFGFQKG